MSRAGGGGGVGGEGAAHRNSRGGTQATVENAESERAALGYRLEAAAAAAQAETEGRASAALFMRAAGDADGLSAAREEELAKLRAQADRLVEAEVRAAAPPLSPPPPPPPPPPRRRRV